MKAKARLKLSVWQYLSIGYLTAIVLGSVLLILPFATREGVSAPYLDALFTAASATCVTGLVVHDTNVYWSVFGQIVILFLIQMGGLGFTTFVSILFMMVKRGALGLYERSAVMQSFGNNKLSAVGKLVKRIVIGTFAMELIGAAVLCIRFVPDFGGIGVYYALFHAVSAFCNAGFDLLGSASAQFVSLTAYGNDALVSLTVSVLVIIGGLGFIVWGDVFDCKLRFKKFQFYTKFILLVNTVLLCVSTLLFLLFERADPAFGDTFWQKLLHSFFNAASARTAGYASADPQSLSESGYLLTVILMFIGGCSGSTAGGIKVGTFAVIVMGMVTVLRGKRDINIGKRRIESTLMGQALAIFIAYLMLVLTATLVILAIEPSAIAYNGTEVAVTFKEVLFETVSALGTVGLTLSLTPVLSVASKLIVILLMYLGRVGVLTLAFALRRKREEPEVRKPLAETLYIG